MCYWKNIVDMTWLCCDCSDLRQDIMATIGAALMSSLSHSDQEKLFRWWSIIFGFMFFLWYYMFFNASNFWSLVVTFRTWIPQICQYLFCLLRLNCVVPFCQTFLGWSHPNKTRLKSTMLDRLLKIVFKGCGFPWKQLYFSLFNS